MYIAVPVPPTPVCNWYSHRSSQGSRCSRQTGHTRTPSRRTLRSSISLSPHRLGQSTLTDAASAPLTPEQTEQIVCICAKGNCVHLPCRYIHVHILHYMQCLKA